MNANQQVLVIAEPVRESWLRNAVRMVLGRFHNAHSLRLIELCKRYDASWERYAGSSVYLKRCTGKRWIRFRRSYMQIVKDETGDLTCAYCGKTGLLSNGNESPLRTLATLDHVRPLSKNGKQFDVDNIVICCQSCNIKKADKDYTMALLKKRNIILYYLLTIKHEVCYTLRSLGRFLH